MSEITLNQNLATALPVSPAEAKEQRAKHIQEEIGSAVVSLSRHLSHKYTGKPLVVKVSSVVGAFWQTHAEHRPYILDLFRARGWSIKGPLSSRELGGSTDSRHAYLFSEVEIEEPNSADGEA